MDGGPPGADSGEDCGFEEGHCQLRAKGGVSEDGRASR